MILRYGLYNNEEMTQKDVANLLGISQSYISRIENNASDIRLSTLMKIIREGLGGSLKLNVNI